MIWNVGENPGGFASLIFKACLILQVGFDTNLSNCTWVVSYTELLIVR